MKIQLVSDLHIEFGDWIPEKTDADVVVLAGDIHVAGRGVEWAKKNFKVPVIFTPGNHDYYGSDLEFAITLMRLQAAKTNVHVLQDDEIVIDGVRFIGGTLWTDYELSKNKAGAMFCANAKMTDFRRIKSKSSGLLSPSCILECHWETRRFIESRTKREHTDGKTVVVSHHAPSDLSIPSSFNRGPTSVYSAYASNLDHLMGDHIALWLHGHTHSNQDYLLNGTRVVCNPRGYKHKLLNPGFIPDLVLEI